MGVDRLLTPLVDGRDQPMVYPTGLPWFGRYVWVCCYYYYREALLLLLLPRGFAAAAATTTARLCCCGYYCYSREALLLLLARLMHDQESPAFPCAEVESPISFRLSCQIDYSMLFDSTSAVTSKRKTFPPSGSVEPRNTNDATTKITATTLMSNNKARTEKQNN